LTKLGVVDLTPSLACARLFLCVKTPRDFYGCNEVFCGKKLHVIFTAALRFLCGKKLHVIFIKAVEFFARIYN
jgi:hypothetical protein